MEHERIGFSDMNHSIGPGVGGLGTATSRFALKRGQCVAKESGLPAGRSGQAWGAIRSVSMGARNLFCPAVGLPIETETRKGGS